LTFSSSRRTLVQYLCAPAHALWEVSLCYPSSLLCSPLLPHSATHAGAYSSRCRRTSINWLCRSRPSLAGGFVRPIASSGCGFPGCGGGGTTPWRLSSPVPSSPGSASGCAIPGDGCASRGTLAGPPSPRQGFLGS